MFQHNTWKRMNAFVVVFLSLHEVIMPFFYFAEKQRKL